MNCLICDRVAITSVCIFCQKIHLVDSNGYALKTEYIVGLRGSKFWYYNNKLHRENGPAIEWTDGDKWWYNHGQLHRINGPAIECVSGNNYWYLNGKRHREGGPAIEWSTGTKEWYMYGSRHREDGPAIEWSSGFKDYWVDDKEMTEQQFKHWQKQNKGF